MGLFRRGPRGRLIAPAEYDGGLSIHELVGIRRFMRGGGWCAVSFGVKASFPLVDDDGLDVSWQVAKDSLIDSAELFLSICHGASPPWSDSDASELRAAIDGVRRAPSEAPWETKVGPSGAEMFYWLIPTEEAARRGVVLELLVQQGRRSWIERGSLPSTR